MVKYADGFFTIGAFNCKVAENLIAEEAEAKTEERSTDELKSKSKKEKQKHKQKQGQAANKEPKVSRAFCLAL